MVYTVGNFHGPRYDGFRNSFAAGLSTNLRVFGSYTTFVPVRYDIFAMCARIVAKAPLSIGLLVAMFLLRMHSPQFVAWSITPRYSNGPDIWYACASASPWRVFSGISSYPSRLHTSVPLLPIQATPWLRLYR